MKNLLRILALITYYLLPITFPLSAQTVYEHTSSTGIYTYLDEMANEKIITLNTAVKPYSRVLIAEKLKQISQTQDKLTKRQKADLSLYMREFYIELQTDSIKPYKPYYRKNQHTISLLPIAYSFSSKPFSLNVRPLGGTQLFTNKKSNVYENYVGASFFTYGLGHIGIYANYRDLYQANDVLAMPTYLTQSPGANYKINEGQRKGGDYSEMRGGITATYKWFSLELIKDHITWGNNYNGSNILSGRTPSFAMIKMRAKPTKWFELNYFHGWLVSEVVDSSRTYIPGGGQQRIVYRDKYIAANFITIGPIKGAALSFGNSIIYSDMNVQPAYFIPFLFYKSVDHTINNGIDNQNSQIFFDLSIRSLKHLHLYSSLFIDEFSITRIKDKERHNFYSIKAGAHVTNWPIKNINYTIEYTESNPLTYNHRVESLTYATNRFNLGQYLGDNSREYFASIGYKPIRGLSLNLSYTQAQKGIEHPYIVIPGQPVIVDKYSLLDTIVWKSTQLEAKLTWEFTYNFTLSLGYAWSNITAKNTTNQTADYYLERYTPAFLRGKNNTISIGLHCGF